MSEKHLNSAARSVHPSQRIAALRPHRHDVACLDRWALPGLLPRARARALRAWQRAQRRSSAERASLSVASASAAPPAADARGPARLAARVADGRPCVAHPGLRAIARAGTCAVPVARHAAASERVFDAVCWCRARLSRCPTHAKHHALKRTHAHLRVCTRTYRCAARRSESDFASLPQSTLSSLPPGTLRCAHLRSWICVR